VKQIIAIAFNEVGISSFDQYIVEDKKMIRKIDPQNLIGDPKKSEKILGWKRTFKFEQIIKEMVLFDISELKLGTKSIWLDKNV
jgi:GDPmannose 4,6-dehydratase